MMKALDYLDFTGKVVVFEAIAARDAWVVSTIGLLYSFQRPLLVYAPRFNLLSAVPAISYSTF